MPFVVSQSGGQVAFNGGTITAHLLIDTSGDALGGNVFEGTATNVAAGSGTDLVMDAYGDVILTGSAGNSSVFRANTSPATNQSDVGSDGMTYTDSVGALIAAIDTRGVVISLHAAPADGVLQNGECALWFDQTNGAAKLMVKARQANGTVRTGSLALT